jgi:hypothetical protein
MLLVVFGLVVSAALAAPPAKVPLTVRTVTYGEGVTLTATSPVADPGARAIVLSRPCGFNAFTTVLSRSVPPQGKFAYSIQPTLNTLYRVSIADREVVNLSVRVRPQLKLTRISGNRYRAEVTTANGSGLGGHSVFLQRRSAMGGWTTVGSVHLKLISRSDQIDAVAAGTGTAVGKGPVRAVLTSPQAAPCFAGTASPVR